MSYNIGQLCYISESAAGIRYHNIETKQRRPFIVFNTTENNVVFLPCSSFKNSINWIEVSITGRKSYIMVNLPTVLSKAKIKNLENKIDKNGKKSIEKIENVILLNNTKIKQINNLYLRWFINNK